MFELKDLQHDVGITGVLQAELQPVLQTIKLTAALQAGLSRSPP